MASVAAAALPSLYSSSSSISRSSRLEISLPSSSSSSSSFSFLPRTNNVAAHLTVKRKNYFHGIITRVNAAAAEEETGTTTTLVPEGGGVETAEAVAKPTITIPVSPADMLTMFFEAEGTMKESDAPKVISALEKIEGVTDIDVRVDGSVATVMLTKQTVYLAKEVASQLVEVIQGCGFKLLTLKLGITDEDDENHEIETLASY